MSWTLADVVSLVSGPDSRPHFASICIQNSHVHIERKSVNTSRSHEGSCANTIHAHSPCFPTAATNAPSKVQRGKNKRKFDARPPDDPTYSPSKRK